MTETLKATNWIDDEHGYVTQGKYAGCLLAAGDRYLSPYRGPWVRIFTNSGEWTVLKGNSVPLRSDENVDHLAILKKHIDGWLAEAASVP